MRMRYNLSFLVVAMLLLTGVYAPKPLQANTLDHYALNQADFLLGEQEGVPSLHDGRLQKVSLPHNWSDALPNQGGTAWYQLHQKQANKDEPWAVYLPILNMNAAVYVNGEFVGSGGQFTEPIARYWNTPLYFLVPSAILQDHDNTISIRLKGYANAGTGLGVVYMGPDRLLKPEFESMFNQRHTFSMIAFFFTLLLSLLSMLMGILRRSELMYAWFSLSTMMYSLFLANHFVHDIPVSRYVWEWALHSSTEWCVFFLMMFTHAFLGIKRRWLEKILFVVFLSTSLWLFVLPNEQNMFFFFNITHILPLLLAVYIVVMFVIKKLEEKHRAPLLTVIIILLSVIVIFAAHDLSMGLTPNLHNASFILSLSAPLLPVVLGWMLIYRLVRLQHQADSFAEDLEQEVEETKSKLHQEFKAIQHLEQERLMSNERERMMQDLHDELGGQLVSACALASRSLGEDSDLKQMLNRALMDLRVVIDSLDDENRNLSTLLGMLRIRLEPQLKIHGIRLIWKLEDGPELDHFEQAVALNILRIVQEAITNAIRHAQCSEIKLRIQARNGVVRIEVQDNGVGMRDAIEGRGTTNMRKRARRIKAELNIESSDHGVKVQVIVAHAPMF